MFARTYRQNLGLIRTFVASMGAAFVVFNVPAVGGNALAEMLAESVESGVKIQDISYDVEWKGDKVTITGELRIPEHGKGKIPAVLVLHSRGGIDGTGMYHVKSFNKAGIATLEIDMFGPRGISRGEGLHTDDNLPDTFGGLNFLSENPAIDSTKIAIAGYSWGGILAMKSMMKSNIEKFGKPGQKFAAHVAYYPVCFAMMKEYVGDKFNVAIGTEPWTDDRLLILVGEKDDYEGPDTCKKFIVSLSEKKQRQATVHIYPGAGHGFDVPSDHGRTYKTKFACFNKGCEVKHYRNDKAAADSLKREISFIRKTFALPPTVLTSSPVSAAQSLASAAWKADCAAQIKKLEARTAEVIENQKKRKALDLLAQAEGAIGKGNQKDCEKKAAKVERKLSAWGY